LQWQEITPVFCDIDPLTHSLDPRRVEEATTPRTTGIIGVHLWGKGCDAESLAEVARQRRLRLMFDAAHAFACSYKEKMIGGFGSAEAFSFHATKFINTFEGGAVATNDDDLAARLRLMRNFGFAGYDNVLCVGANGKMSEVSAAMGLTSMESLPEFIAVNRRNYELYRALLSDVPGISLISYNESEKCNYQYVILEVDESGARISRDELMEILWAENVIARRYFFPGCHRMEPYRSLFHNAKLSLPVTEALCRRVLSLPTGTTVSEDHVRIICHLVAFAVENGDKVRAKLGRATANIDAPPNVEGEAAFLAAGPLCS
jgi:dTDP-4-amino-4,6-dideoxygalactose transaminase